MNTQTLPIAGIALHDFYVTGGTLQRDATCYVRRQADEDLYAGLSAGQFCYVLTSRQMGKSSLMVRAAARLRAEGFAVVVLDLTAIGQNLSAEQWYDGLVTTIGQQLDLADELDDFWFAHKNLGPLQRWLHCLREIVLPQRAERIVIFVDEIDVVRSLPFSTDEFFAGIRELHNERTQQPELNRLTFCLLGVAAPSDLIQDTRTTPFNIGQRIALTDFTAAEAAPLAFGLGREEQTGLLLLQRVLHWTGGHPYLTQRLCQAVAEDATIHDEGDTDRLCAELFLSARARERDDNLLFVRERLLRSETDLAGLLTLYEKIWRGKQVADDETNPLITVLHLSGITKEAYGHLIVRNRIYEHVFDRDWVKVSMPDAELQRQRAAFRRGVWRTAAIAAIFLIAVSALTIAAMRQKNRADETAQELRSTLRLAEDRQQELEIERGRLLDQQQQTLAQRQIAEEQSLLADERRLEAEDQRHIAEQQRAFAEQQRAFAEQQQTIAEEKRREAEVQRNEAERQRTIAEAERERIENDEANTRDVIRDLPLDGKRRALDYYQQVLRLMREVGDRDGEASTLIHMGVINSTLSERTGAMELFNQALTISREQNNKTLSARALSGIGGSFDNLGERRKAIENYNEALTLWQDLGVRSAQAELLARIGKSHSGIGDNQTAIRYLNQSHTLWRAIGGERGEAGVLLDFGNVYYAMGERQKALEMFQQSLALSQGLRDKRRAASLLGNIGVIYRNLGQPARSMENYQRALPLWRELGERKNEATILNNMGTATDDLGKDEEALEFYQQALKIQQEIGDRVGEARTLSNMGAVYDDLGKKEEALAHYQRALPLRRAVSDLNGEAYTHINIGKLYSKYGEHQKALEHLTLAEQLLRKTSNRRFEARTLNEIGVNHAKLGDKQKAITAWQQALAIWRDLKDSVEEKYTEKLLAELQ